MEKGFIKGDRTKHISPKFFFTHELNHKEIEVTKVASDDNVADIFTKSLPLVKHCKFIPLLGLRKLSELTKTK